MSILVVAGGPKANWPRLDHTDYEYFVGVDRGAWFIAEQGWPLDLAVGDFDSLSDTERLRVLDLSKEVHTSHPEKDDTDTQLALQQVLDKFPQGRVTIIGATGGRLDHFLANLWLPLEERFQPFAHQITLMDQQNTITYHLPGEHTIYKEQGKDYLAYCCLTPVTELTLRDSKYLLDRQQVATPFSYSSNEFVGETAFFSFTSGVIAVIQSSDSAE